MFTTVRLTVLLATNTFEGANTHISKCSTDGNQRLACDHCGQLSLHSSHQNRQSTEVISHAVYRKFLRDCEHILFAISARTFAFSC